MEILDFQQSCSSAVARAFTQPQFLCSFPCPVGRFQRPASLSTQAVTGWRAGATRGRGAKSWAWELCCALAGGPSLPTAALCSLPDPAPGSRAPAAPACCRPAKGNEGFFCYLYLWQHSNTNVKSRLILSFLYIKASTQSRCSQIYYPLYCAYWF